jgi:hypothetical protein
MCGGGEARKARWRWMKKIIFGDSSFWPKCEGRPFLPNGYTNADYNKACTTAGIVDSVIG